ncbi:MAG: endonuclease/exonuclease/phosphatase family protein [Campylobacteraceae bacterium]|nr:endonuclease/exonuclease/phosphatase family protein [Campylobacteraceae bacterium]
MKALFWILCAALLFAEEFCIATYNVENLFDAKKDGTEYKEFIPSKYGWSEEEAENKFKNTIRVLKDLDSDIIALQEIENEALIKRLKDELGFGYHVFGKNQNAAVGLGVISKYEIVKTQSFSLKGYEKFRPILHVKIKAGSETFSIFANHFPSLNNPDSTRVAYSNALNHYMQNGGENKSILLGDFNVLDYENSPLGEALEGKVYDLWNELTKKNRWNYVYKSERNALDMILVSKNFLEEGGIKYKKGSFEVFKPKYLLTSKNAPKGNFRGFSDHLPLKACFETPL